MSSRLVFLTYTYPDEDGQREKIFGLKKDIQKICQKCQYFVGCDWENEDCIDKFCKICWQDKEIIYESEEE
ncbi:MAG: hypothetical protein DDT19_00067 [Syntrophomonadaceae bacterium]|nr:hypothetical protein [Bacillota bacterium]